MSEQTSSDTGTVTSTVDRKSDPRDLVSRFRSMWRGDQAPDALEFLAEHSSVRENRALSLELAYEEYCVRRENGESLDIAVFCERFPSISRSLHRQIEVDEYIRGHPSIIGQEVAVAWPRRGDALAGFVVVEEIGRGAFARAYLCAQPGIGNRHVVVKVSRGGTLEADTMGALDHPNIMSVYSVQVDKESNLSAICMPFVGRSTLYDVIDVAYGQERPPQQTAVILEASRASARRGDRYHQVTPRMHLRPGSPFLTGALQLMLQISEALAHAHEQGVLHGDLKPSNIVMSIAGMPMLVDFNLSQSCESNNLVTGGTLPYMAPEQIRSMLLGPDRSDRVDQRSDIFSLGVILFELLTGRLPFEASQPETEPFAAAGRMLDAQNDGVASLRPLMRDLDPGLTDLLASCLSLDAQDRPQDIRRVSEEIRRYLSWTHRFRRALRRHRPARRHPRRDGRHDGRRTRHVVKSTALCARSPFPAGCRSISPTRLRGRYRVPRRCDRGRRTVRRRLLGPRFAAMQRFELDKFDGWLDFAFQNFTLADAHGCGSEALNARAYCLIRKNDFELAIHDLEELEQSGEVSAEVANNLAYCYEKMAGQPSIDPNRFEDLIQKRDRYLRLACSLAEDAPEPRVNLAILELSRYRSSDGDYLPSDGLDAARRAIELGSDSTAIYVVAAKLAGVLAAETGDDALIDQCLDFLECAVDRGHSLAQEASQSRSPFGLLVDHPRFRMLLRKQVEPVSRTGAERVMVPDVMSSRLSLTNKIAP